jgi:hypothetical protein
MSHDEERASLLDGRHHPHGATGGNHYGYGTPRPSSPISSPLKSASARHRRNSMAAMAIAADIRTSIPGPPLVEVPSMDSLEADGAARRRRAYSRHDDDEGKVRRPPEGSIEKTIRDMTSQLPAILTVSFMLGIPFGAAFFPTELELPGKEILGLRMFLFSSMVAQLVFTYSSKFTNCIGVQMVENVPFYLELARILIAEEGNGEAAISTLFFLSGLSSVIVGSVFYLLGRFELGRVLYFFPKQVLVGCIGGIGLFIVITALEVSTNATFSFTADCIDGCVVRNFHLLLPVLAFE